jgi:hypothetical protein
MQAPRSSEQSSVITLLCEQARESAIGSPRMTRWLVTATIASLLIAMLAVPASAIVPACRVTNLSTGQVYDGSGSNLQTAIDQASPGTHLRIRGVCQGSFSIAKRLRLLGWATAAFPVPTLEGDATGTVLTVGNASVTIVDLTITNGGGDVGGGIHNSGNLTLTGTTSVTMNGGFDAPMGGGIYNAGALAMRRSSSVTDNEGGMGGGIFNDGILDLFGGSSISDNFGSSGGGVSNSAHAIARLHGSSSISDNAVFFTGGGVDNEGRLVLHDRASVRDNEAALDHSEGGGVYNFGIVIMNDSSSLANNLAGDGGTSETFGGGGILNGGTLTMRHSASIKNNASTINSVGGGITNFATVTMRGQSVVRGNTSGADGGGIFNAEGTFTMLGGSSVRRNTADGGDGGGIFNDSGALVGAVAGSNVINNVPDDIAP